jgi:hypothetical protein
MKPAKPQFLVTVHSQKGGTGKTTLSLLLQYALAYHEPPLSSVVIDLDLTGTSPADVLQLRALPSKGKRRLSQQKIQNEMAKDVSCWDSNLAYINYWLFSPPNINENIYPRFRMNHYIWELCNDFKTPCGLVPSSRHPDDIREAMEAIHYNEATELISLRLEEFICELFKLQDRRQRKRQGRISTYDVVIVDTSPTLFGTSRIAYELHNNLSNNNNLTVCGDCIHSIALHLMSPDLQSVRGSMSAFHWLESKSGCNDNLTIPTMHIINMLPRFEIDELGFQDRSKIIDYYASALNKVGIDPPGDDTWIIVPWDRSIIRFGIEPSAVPKWWELALNENVKREISEIVTRMLRISDNANIR